MRHLATLALALGTALLVGACQSTAPEPLSNLRRPLAKVSKVDQAIADGWVPASELPTPRPSATPLPEGRATPKPASAFPSEPTGSSGGTGGSGGSIDTSTPVPEVPVPTLQPAVVVSNTLPAGSGAIGGVIVDVPNGATPVGEATVRIALEGAAAKQAVLKNAGDGTYRLTGLAYGTYLVRAEKGGYVGDAAPIVVTLTRSAPSLGRVNMVLVKP